MKRETLIAATVLLAAILTGFAQPGPYPVIFVHGNNDDADPDIGLETWTQGGSAMMEILAENNGQGYAGYQKGSPRDCKVNTTLDPSNNHSVYNFSYYNVDCSAGTIGNRGPYFSRLHPVDNSQPFLLRHFYDHYSDESSWAEHLGDFIDKVLAATGASKVNIVCHSMGGLVARDAITFYGYSDKVYKVLMVGTPNHGFNQDGIVE